jgi:hypothetical protein
MKQSSESRPRKQRTRRWGPVSGMLRRRHAAACEVPDDQDCLCPIYFVGVVNGRRMKRALGTDWAAARAKLKELVVGEEVGAEQSGATAATEPASRTRRGKVQLERAYADLLTRVDVSRTVRIPRTSARASQRIYAKLLTRVDPQAQTGFGFEGTLLRPGDVLPLSALWPTPDHPAVPVLLECAGSLSKPATGHARRSQEDLYLLWKFDAERAQWKEIARSSSTDWSWAIDLRPIAVRLLRESRGAEVQVFAGLQEVCTRLWQALDEEIGRLAPPDQLRAGAALHDQLCFRMLELQRKNGLLLSGDFR